VSLLRHGAGPGHLKVVSTANVDNDDLEADMKFPKSMHAEGWASHLDETRPEHLPDALKPAGQVRPAVGPARFKPTGAAAKISIHAPLDTAAAAAPRVEPAYVRLQTSTAPAAAIERDRPIGWLIPAGVGVAIIAAVAIWAMNRPSQARATPPALVVGSAAPQAEVAEATPAPEAPTASQVEHNSATTVAAAPAAVEPAPRVSLPVTTSRPAAESRTAAQAQVPPARPDIVLRAAHNSPAANLAPPMTVAAAPANAQPLSVLPGAAPLVIPPTAAGPATVTQTQTQPMPPTVAPQAVTAPLALAVPDSSASSAVPAAAPLAQAQPQVLPQAEDSGITAKVRLALAADATLSAVPILVSTDHGVVKLEGQVPDSQTRDHATFVASSPAGVKAIDNRLTLPPPTVVGQAPVVQRQ
jgi:hypothetical protein